MNKKRRLSISKILIIIVCIVFIFCFSYLFLGCNTAGSGGPDTPPSREFTADANTLALFHFNETSGQVVYDSSGNNYDLFLGSEGTVEAADPTMVDSGRSGFGNCLSFDGGNSQYAYGNHTLSVSTNHDVTVELWVKSSTPGFSVLYKAENISLDVSKDFGDGVYFGVGDGSSWSTLRTTTPEIADGNWYYIACTYDYSETTSIVYINGTEALSSNSIDAAIPDITGINVGGRPGNTFLTGYIDEMRISDIPRTETEIQNYYNNATVE